MTKAELINALNGIEDTDQVEVKISVRSTQYPNGTKYRGNITGLVYSNITHYGNSASVSERGDAPIGELITLTAIAD